MYVDYFVINHDYSQVGENPTLGNAFNEPNNGEGQWQRERNRHSRTG